MSLNKRSPGRLLDKVTAFGSPWHGRVETNRMRLPNGDTRAWPQPSTGDTKLIAFPGLGADRPVDAQGRQWRTRAILSGDNNQLYGRNLGANAWIWRDNAGARWLVRWPQAAAGNLPAGINTTITLERFGELGRAAQSVTLPVVLADCGQSSPVLDVGGNDVTAADARIVDTTTDGARAIIELTLKGDANPITWPVTARWRPSIGYLELALSGAVGADAAALLTVLRSRSQTIGAYTYTSQDDSEWVYARLDSTVQQIGNCPVYDLVETASGVTFFPYEVAPGFGFPVKRGSTAYAGATLGRVIAMWYHEDVAQEVTFEVEVTSTAAAVLSSTVSGQRITTVYCDGSPSDYSGSVTWTVSQSCASSSNVRARLLVNGVVVDQGEWSWSRAAERTVSRTNPGAPTTTYLMTVSDAWSGGAGAASDVYSQNRPLPSFSQGWPIEGVSYSTFAHPENQGLDYMAHALQGAAVGPDGKVYGHVLVHPHVYANHAVGLVVAAREEWREADSGLSSNQWRAIAHPGGVNNTVVEDRSGANAVTSLGGLRYASWCPLTGELARDRTTAVCFV